MPKNSEEQTLSTHSSKKWKRWVIGLGLIVLVLGLVIAGNAFVETPTEVGKGKGQLASCPNSPNCVCSQDEREIHHIAPFPLGDDPHAGFARLIKVLKTWPRTRIVTQTETYLHVTFTTRILRFVDDGEFLLDVDAGLIHIRSASRVGHSDMGVNRKRMEKIRLALQEALK